MKSNDKLSLIFAAAKTLNDSNEPTTAMSMFNDLQVSESNCTLQLNTLD